MVWSFERVAGRFSFTEGPVWTGDSVLFTDIRNSRIMRYVPTTGSCTTAFNDTAGANGLALDRLDRLYVCEGGGRRVARYEKDGTTTTLADRFEGRRLNEPNDIVVDDRGRIWFTDPCYGDRSAMELDHDSVYRLDPDSSGTRSINRVTSTTRRPNGLAFSPDYATLYVAESPPAPVGSRQLRAYPVNPDGSLGAYRVLHDFGPHRGIDGMRVDTEGFIVATCGWDKSGPGPRVAVFSPDGTVVGEHPTPTDPTNCCFGGSDLRDLYVTGFDGGLYHAVTDRVGARRP